MAPWLRAHGFALACLAALAVVLIAGAHASSPTYDEPHHLVRGLSFWWTGSTWLSVAHPPLANAVTAAPTAWGDPAVDLRGFLGWYDGSIGQVARGYFAHDYSAARDALMSGRIVMALLTVGLGALIYWFCWRRFGSKTALFALVLLATQPPLLAHGRFVTTDLPVTLGIFATAVALTGFLERRSAWATVFLVLAIGWAVLTKFTGLIVLPIAAVLALVWAMRGWGRYGGTRRALRWLTDLFVIGSLTLVTLGAGYRFERTGLSAHDVLNEPLQGGLKRRGKFLQKHTILDELPESLPVPVPVSFIVGLAEVRDTARSGRQTYFLERWRDHGSPAYFPVLLATQLTIGLLLGLVALAFVLVSHLRNRDHEARGSPTHKETASIVLVTFGGVLLVGVIGSKLNLGLRHALPVVPFVAVAAARGFVGLIDLSRARLMSWAVWATLLSSVVTAGVAFPRYLGYYNWLAGGRTRGHGISLLGEDWGQDVIDLAHVAHERGWTDLWYHGYVRSIRHLELEHHGIASRRLRCRKGVPVRGIVAVHANIIMRGKCFPGLADRTPILRIGEHIYVYELPGPGGDP